MFKFVFIGQRFSAAVRCRLVKVGAEFNNSIKNGSCWNKRAGLFKNKIKLKICGRGLGSRSFNCIHIYLCHILKSASGISFGLSSFCYCHWPTCYSHFVLITVLKLILVFHFYTVSPILLPTICSWDGFFSLVKSFGEWYSK